MKIFVPKNKRNHFWEDPPPECDVEFWAYKEKPKCEPGEKILFYFDHKMVATSRVAYVEPPGRSSDYSTGAWKDHWKVFWYLSDFKDLRFAADSMFGSLFNN